MLVMPWTHGDGRLVHYKANPICPTFGVGDHTLSSLIVYNEVFDFCVRFLAIFSNQ